MLTLIAERINMTRKTMREKIWERDTEYVISEVKKQEDKGATHIDINAGGDPSKEVDDMKWLAELVSQNTELPISFDSANPDALRAGLEICNRPGTIINSITAEKKRIENTLPLVEEFNTHVIALAMDDTGMPPDFDARIKVVDNLVSLFREHDISLERVHMDALAQPVSSNPEQIAHTINAIKYISDTYPEMHTMVGLSNVSYGIPQRIHMNRAFFVLLLNAGIDGAIVDTTSGGMMGIIYATLALLGKDEYCMNYIMAARENML
jgi:cobalamin-dependent methionine synthase I